MGNERKRTDERKFVIASDIAFNRAYETLDFFEPEYYRVYHNKTYYFYDILSDYEKAYKLFKEANPDKIVTVFDKALCYAMVLRKYKTFGCVATVNVPKRVSLINERYIVEVMLSILHFSEYSVKAPGKQRGFVIVPTPFDLETLFAEHKDVLEGKIRNLMVLLSSEEFMATDILNVLREIYDLAILYGNAFDEADFERARKRIRVKEVKNAPCLNFTQSESFRWRQDSLTKGVIR